MVIYIHVPPSPHRHHRVKHWKPSFEMCYRLETSKQQKNLTKKMSIDLKRGRWRRKMCIVLLRNSNCFLLAHSWIQHWQFFSSSLLLLTCIGFLGRQQLFDDDVFIYGSLSLFAQRILSDTFFFAFFSFIIFQRKYFQSRRTDIRIHWNNTYTHICMLKENISLKKDTKKMSWVTRKKISTVSSYICMKFIQITRFFWMVWNMTMICEFGQLLFCMTG